MVVRLESCIYCGSLFRLTEGREGDHVIPRALGQFEGDIHFHRICAACNREIGAVEEELLRCGPEAFFRNLVGASRRRKNTKSSLSVPSKGGVAPQFTANLGGHSQLCKFDAAAEQTTPRDSLVAPDDKGVDIFVEMHPQMSVKQLKQKLRAAGITGWERARVHFDEANQEAYRHLFSELGVQIAENLPDTPEGLHNVVHRVHFKFSEKYYRALAKIAFHYFLTRSSRRVRGYEIEYAEIREFIRKGSGNSRQFFVNPTVGFEPFPEQQRPSRWGHMLFSSEGSRLVEVYFNLYMGPRIVRKGNWIRIGRTRALIEAPPYAFGHAYLYDKNGDKFDGSVMALGLSPFPPSSRSGRSL